MKRRTFILLAMATLAGAGGCASSGADFQPTGGIVVASGNGARFNANHIDLLPDFVPLRMRESGQVPGLM